MGNLHLVTGYSGVEHVTAADDGSLNAAIFGTGHYVLNRGNCFYASVITNNLVRIEDGDILMQGRHVRLNEGNFVDLVIENGSQGMKRNDLIVCRYTKNTGTGVEECELIVIKGTATSGTAMDPDYIRGDILVDHSVQCDFPLYRIPLDNLTVGEPERLFEIADGMGDRIIPVSKGGTGASSASEARNTLGVTPENIGAAKSKHTHSPSDLSSVIPVEKGGTGSDVPEQALINLGALRTFGCTYIGTGVGGSVDKPTVIEFPFEPGLVVIRNKSNPNQVVIPCIGLSTHSSYPQPIAFDYTSKQNANVLGDNETTRVHLYCWLKMLGNGRFSLNMYSQHGAAYQLNDLEQTYYVVAFGLGGTV